MKKTDLAYTAGIIDGEGCISIGKQTDRSSRRGFTYSLQVNVKSVDEWLPAWLQFSFGGGLHTYTNQADNCMWSWTITCKKASEFLKLIFPYLNLKRPQAEIALRFQARKCNRGRVGKTDREVALEEAEAILLKATHNVRNRQKINSNLIMEVN